MIKIAEDSFPYLQSRRSFCSINKWYAPILNITTFKYPHEAEDMFSYERIKSRFPEMEMHLFGHSADSANRWDFYPPPRWEDKKIDTQGFGYDGRCVFPFMASPQRPILTFFVGLRFSFYPIRTTITNALKQSAKSGTDIKWHPHPGYSISRPEDVKAPEFYPKKSPLHEKHRELRADFAAGMRNTKICVVRHFSCFPPFRKPARWELTQTGSPRFTVRFESREEDDPKVGAGALERMRGRGRHSYGSGGRAEGVHDRAQAGLANRGRSKLPSPHLGLTVLTAFPS